MAIVNLLKQTHCNIIAGGDAKQISNTIAAVSEEQPLQKLVIPTRAQYEGARPSNEPPFVRHFDRETETDEIAVIMHSSGSTGLPKSVSLSHKNILTHPVQGAGMNNFGALPLYHIYGLSTTLQAMYMRKVANMFSASLPMTGENLITAIEATQPEIFHAVPYALGLLVEHERGMAYLKTAKIVTAAGARTPDELGNRLIRENVNFGVVFGWWVVFESNFLVLIQTYIIQHRSWTNGRYYAPRKRRRHLGLRSYLLKCQGLNTIRIDWEWTF